MEMCCGDSCDSLAVYAGCFFRKAASTVIPGTLHSSKFMGPRVIVLSRRVPILPVFGVWLDLDTYHGACLSIPTEHKMDDFRRYCAEPIAVSTRRSESPVHTVNGYGPDPEFIDLVGALPGGESLRACLGCGTCSMSCPIREVNEAFNPRRVIRMCLLGMREQVLRSPFVWLCSNCYACQERCPQGIRIADFMESLKNLAFREGNAPEGARTQMERILEMGRIYEISDFDNKKRLKAGLPELPGSIQHIRLLISGNST